MADVTYSAEVQSILDLLRLRQPAGHLDLHKLPLADLDPDNFAAASCVRKLGRRQVYYYFFTLVLNSQGMKKLRYAKQKSTNYYYYYYYYYYLL